MSDDTADDTFTCGELFCELCGDCLYCYGDDPCYDGGEHQWPSREES